MLELQTISSNELIKIENRTQLSSNMLWRINFYSFCSNCTETLQEGASRNKFEILYVHNFYLRHFFILNYKLTVKLYLHVHSNFTIASSVNVSHKSIQTTHTPKKLTLIDLSVSLVHGFQYFSIVKRTQRALSKAEQSLLVTLFQLIFGLRSVTDKAPHVWQTDSSEYNVCSLSIKRFILFNHHCKCLEESYRWMYLESLRQLFLKTIQVWTYNSRLLEEE